MSNDIDSALAALKVKFLGRSKDLATQLFKDLDRLDADGDAAKALIISAHKLSGGGGTFGYPLLSRIAGDMEILLDNSNRDGARMSAMGHKAAIIVPFNYIRFRGQSGRKSLSG